MNNQYNILLDVVESAIFRDSTITEIELRILIKKLSQEIAPDLLPDELEKIAREIEARQGIKIGFGSIVDNPDFEPWLDKTKPAIDPFYWNRYKKLLRLKRFPRDVIISLDTITDKILDRLGNPNLSGNWDRRGMVVGHVQSGKTANYTGLICKAADAGYRLIIVIAGLQNNLRNQTQARIDEGFIGRDTGKSLSSTRSKKNHSIGVGELDKRKTPVSLTNTYKDFHKETATTNTSEIDSYNVPVVLVIKKNKDTLSNLIGWLRDNSTRGNREMIDQPMLLIDDEADNASINTKYSKEETSRINSQIRELLNLFHRSCYVGYTATPFANIFIDPDSDDEMFKEDLFPRDFIIGLDAPSNYFGPQRIFDEDLTDENDTKWIRFITDNEDVLPIRHKIDHTVEVLPDSLVEALRVFLLTRTLRNLRGQKDQHCSMLVNPSRFNSIQRQIFYRLHDALEEITNAVRISANKGDMGLKDPEILALNKVWEKEFRDVEFEWSEIQASLHESIASTKLVEVNSLTNELDYSASTGQTVVVIGGFSLSRGVTLEGLTVSWILRNSMMYDTIMQMGRWFGYRDNYEDLCRIWMPMESVEWYAFITEASEELYLELKNMDEAGASPDMYGLEVRSHPLSLMVTARNKMGSGQKIVSRVGLANKYIETVRVSLSPNDLVENLRIGKLFINKLDHANLHQEKVKGGTLVRDVPVEFIDDFLAGWRNADASVLTKTDPIREYIDTRKQGELRLWDVFIPSLIKGEPDYSLGWPIKPSVRTVSLMEAEHYMSIGGQKLRLASRGIEKVGVDPLKALDAENEYVKRENLIGHKKINFPDKIYRNVRDKGLFILFLVKAKTKDTDLGSKIPQFPLVAWGISLPRSDRPTIQVEYVVNSTRMKELFRYEVDD